MPVLTALLLAATAATETSPLPAVPAPTPPAPSARFAPDPTFLRDSAQTKNWSLGRPTKISVLPDGSAVLFLRSGPRDPTLALYEYVVATGETREVITPAELLKGAEETLSVAERARRERQRVQAKGFTTYQLSQDGRLVLVTLSGKLYAVERATKKVRALYAGDAPILDPQFSPDGTRVAYVKQNDVWVVDVATGRERRVTTGGTDAVTHGVAEFVAQEEMDRFTGFWWSPDSTTIAFEEADHRGVEQFHLADPAHPERAPDVFPYPRPGRANVAVRLGLVKATGGRVTWVDWNREAFEYLARVIWKEAKAPLTIAVQSRRQERLQLLSVDVKSGRTRLLREWTDEAWLNLDVELPAWLPDGGGLLWAEDRPEGRALLLARGDAKPVVVVPPKLQFQRIVHLDRTSPVARVLVAPTPTTVTLAAASLAGDAVALAFPAEAGPVEHDVVFAKDGSVFVDTHVDATSLASSTVYRGDATRVGDLPAVAERPTFAAGVELTRVEAGGRSYEAAIVRPRGFDAKQRYPVVLSVYGGPHVNVVRANQAAWLLPQWIADHGAIVVSIDNRGTPRRGRDWERAIDRNFGEVPLDDQVNALQALGKRFGELDLARVGVYGWSFGGYLSALAVLKRPDVFKVAVAGAPVVDWRDYDTHYTERYLDLPDDNAAGYEASSLLTYAPRLERPLLLIHGTADDNVYFLHSLRLADALFKAGRPFEFLPLPGTHMVAAPEQRERLWGRVTEFLMRELRK